MKLEEIKINPGNPRLINEYNFNKLVESILSFPAMLSLRPIIINEDKMILGGNQRFAALKRISEMDIGEIKAILDENYKFIRLPDDRKDEITSFWDSFLKQPKAVVKIVKYKENEEREFILKDNIHYGEDDVDILKENYDFDEIESYLGDIDQLLYDFDDINDEDIEEDPVELKKLKCAYVVSTLTNEEYDWLEKEYKKSLEHHGTDEFFVREVFL